METITVQVQDDHLEMLSRTRPVAAVAELVWNGLDAEATEVRVDFAENELEGIDLVRVADNGHGLPYQKALEAFRNLGGSWKSEGMRTESRKRLLHGKYGKGRFRAFALGNHVQWHTRYREGDQVLGYSLTGQLDRLGEFELTSPEPCPPDMVPGTTVEIRNLAKNIASLRGMKPVQDVTDLFALYLRQYPDVRLVFDRVPIDPTNAERHCTDYALDEIVTESGDRVRVEMTVVEWAFPGKRGIMLCDPDGFALQPAQSRPYFRGFSYTAYLRSPYFVRLEREGVLQLNDLAPDVTAIVDAARARLREHFTLREAESAQDLLALWREQDLYPYDAEPASQDEENERRIFDIYATHLSQISDFASLSLRNKRLTLRLVRELVASEPTRVARVLDDLLAFPEEKEEAVRELSGAQTPATL